MTTFGLVHGAFHGSWCWERLTPELERLGHSPFLAAPALLAQVLIDVSADPAR